MRTRLARTVVCGVDEAGRGPWAGPVFAAAVILSLDGPIEGLDDSKKLSPRQRETLEVHIKARALAWAVGSASVEEIDVFNILQATGLAMRRAVESLSVSPCLARVDGNYAFKLPCRVQTVVNGDALHPEISAASILAKTARDRLMVAMDACIRVTGSPVTRAMAFRRMQTRYECSGPARSTGPRSSPFVRSPPGGLI